MGAITWNPLFESGDSTIDEQHKSLVRTINRLEAAHSWGTGLKAMGFVLNELETYTRSHFSTEERLFVKIGFPEADAEEHIAEHRQFIETVASLRREFEKGDEAAVTRLLGVLGDWFVHHVANVDLKYRPYLSKPA